MLRQLRESMKTVLWIVVATFVISIFAIWGMDLRTPQRRSRDPNVIGSVGKETISQQAYQDVINQLYNQFKQQKGENYTPSDMERRLVEDQAWELTVQSRLMQREIEKLKITVSDQELVSFLRKNPHPSLQEVFKKEDGTFDYQAYLRALSDPNVDWTQLESWGRSVIPGIKLQTYLVAQVHIPNSEVLERFREQNVQYQAEYIMVPFPATGTPYEPTDVELKTLYDQRLDRFKEPAMRRVRVIEIEKRPSAADERDVRERLTAIRDEIVKGQIDFEAAAKDNSEDVASAEKGGDLGFFKRGDMVPAFDSIAFSLKAGEISMPVRTPYGFHIIRVTERKKEGGVDKVHAEHILMKVEPGYETTDSISTVIRNAAELIRKDGFEKAAADLKLKIFETDPFPQGMFIKNLGYVPRIIGFAFNYKVGDVSTTIETEASVYFVQVSAEIPERVKPMEEVRQQLVDEIRSNRESDAATAIAETIRKEILTSGDFAGVARAHQLQVKETPLFKAHDPIPEIGTNSPFSVACTFLTVGAMSPPIAGQDRLYIIKLSEKKEPDPATFATERDKLRGELLNELSSRFMANWYQAIRDKAQVVDLREKTLN